MLIVLYHRTTSRDHPLANFKIFRVSQAISLAKVRRQKRRIYPYTLDPLHADLKRQKTVVYFSGSELRYGLDLGRGKANLRPRQDKFPPIDSLNPVSLLLFKDRKKKGEAGNHRSN